MSVNKFIGIGRLCAEPELKATPNGSNVLNISMAINENYKDKQGNKVDKTEFVRLTLWNHTANIVNKYCRKGSQIYVEGSLQTREWEKDGQKRWTTEIVVRNVQLLDSKQSNGGGERSQDQEGFQQNNYPNKTRTDQVQSPNDDFEEDMVPF